MADQFPQGSLGAHFSPSKDQLQDSLTKTKWMEMVMREAVSLLRCFVIEDAWITFKAYNV